MPEIENTTSERDTMTTQEACELLGVSRGTLYNRIKEGSVKAQPKAPGARRAFRLVFARADILRLIEENQASPTQAAAK